MENRKKTHPEIKGLLTLVGSVFLFLCMLSFVHENVQANWLGVIGYGVGLALLWLLGLSAYLVAAYIGWIGWKMLTGGIPKQLKMKTVYFSIGVVSLSILLNLFTEMGGLSGGWIERRLFSEIYLSNYPFPHKIVRFNLGGVPSYFLLWTFLHSIYNIYSATRV